MADRYFGSKQAMFATTLLRYMVVGLYSFSAFCFFLSLTLPRTGVQASFLIAVVSALLVQGSTRQLLVVHGPFGNVPIGCAKLAGPAGQRYADRKPAKGPWQQS